jgi:pyruvate, water dikinase
MRRVIDLDGIRAADARLVGAKMARLGELRSRGWRVPDGYAVTAAALSEALSDPASPALGDAVAAAHKRLRQRTGRGQALSVAVRSSGIAEDGAAASYAGQYDTYLGLTEIADVVEHIWKCRDSGRAERAEAYRRRFGGTDAGAGEPDSEGGAHLAVGVLELVDARSAGVVFTLDPVTGDRGRLVVEANWGFGESIVSGHVSPDHWDVDRATGTVLQRRTGAKRRWSAVEVGTGRVTSRELPADLASEPCLSDDEVRYLCDKAAEIEAAEGVPQDVEWAIAKHLPFPDSVFFLQHRPETSWSTPPEAVPRQPARSVRDSASPGEPPEDGFDPVKYALRNVFKVPGT